MTTKFGRDPSGQALDPSRWVLFIALFLLALSYGALLLWYTFDTIICPSHGFGAVQTFAIQIALVWAYVSLCLVAKVVRPY